MPLDREISELIAEVKEHVLYLQELGVDDFRVELPVRSEPPALAGGAGAGVNSAFRDNNAVSPPRLPAKNAGTHASLDKEGSFVAAPPRIGDAEVPPHATAGVPSPPANITTPVQKPPAAGPPPGARLAKLPSLSKRNPPLTARGEAGGSVPAENIEMTRAQNAQVRPVADADFEASVPIKAAKMEDPLFGDAGRELPESSETMEDIWADIGNCTRCPLFEGRTQIVQTTGNYNADLMFIGEAPGADEDAKGEPFVGRAGQLLNKIIEAIGMTRGDVAIGNINRCRPPGNRAPTLPEAHTCRPFLLREIAVIKPKVIVVMGNTALHNLLDTKDGITKVRGRFQDYYGVKVMPTFHPAYLLRDPNKSLLTDL